MLLDAGSAPSLATGFMNYFNYFTEIETRSSSAAAPS